MTIHVTFRTLNSFKEAMTSIDPVEYPLILQSMQKIFEDLRDMSPKDPSVNHMRLAIEWLSLKTVRPEGLKHISVVIDESWKLDEEWALPDDLVEKYDFSKDLEGI